MARHAQLSFDHFGLHQAALMGDDGGVRRALRSGASVNALDSAGRTAVMCAVAGENWEDVDASNASFTTAGHLNVVRTLLRDSQISLVTLNAPQMAYRGVTPLGMAAWLNMSDTVRVLLEESAEYVSVDGADVHGATPLMYAARDGRLDVVQILLRHGARPDLGDMNHRTSVQFSLAFPQILWLCETALRRHRWLESESPDRNRISSNPASEHLLHIANSALLPSRIFEPPALSVFSSESTARLTNTIVQSIHSSDVAFLHSLLFSPAIPASSQSQLYPMSSPVLVNLPDAKGWSPIHYCAAAEYPSIDILDALYCAGAVSLFTTDEHWTPLHCFAQAARRLPHDRSGLCISLCQFITHLVHDLRAPLAARDKQDETCIHIAAETGNCIEMLILLLDCDTTGAVRELRNARGLTALEVCKPEFRAAFGEQFEDLRSASSLSCYTIRPSTSTASLSSWNSGPSLSRVPDDDASLVLDNVDISASSEQLLVNLRLTSPAENHKTTPFHLNFLDNLVREAADITAIVATHYRTITAEATKDVQALRSSAGKLQAALDRASRDVDQSMRARGLSPTQHRKRCNRESEDSQATAVSIDPPANAPSLAVDAADEVYDIFVLKANAQKDGLCAPSMECLKTGSMGLAENAVKHAREEDKSPKRHQSGTTKLKAWMRRKLLPADVAEPQMVGLPLAKQRLRPTLAVIPEHVKPVATSLPATPVDLDLSADEWMNGLLRTSYATLEAASRDLDRIAECIASAEHFVAIVDRCAARAERVVGRALKKREAAIANLRLTTSAVSSGDDFFVRPGVLSPKSSIASLSSVYSARSSCVSLAATLAEQEDDDVRVVRRLLMRKIETGASGAQQELEKGVNWLRIVREVVRGAKKRAYV
ncbi:hypothetical protein B0H10DRAFT_1815316 [Mycena sp. CBHHK59/15]|nr:hypothetical protein B0H10DRAFT_1815316 [Mycena sp. CBHHK59/15]